MQTKYKIEFFHPKSVLLPLVEKMLSLDDYLIDFNSITSINKGDSKLRTLSYTDRCFVINQKYYLEQPKDFDLLGLLPSDAQPFLELGDAFRLISLCHKWQGLEWCVKNLGFNGHLIREFSKQPINQPHLQRLIQDYLIFPCLNGQYEKWIKETGPLYKAIGYQFRTITNNSYHLTDAQWEKQKRTLYPNWHLRGHRYSVCFEPSPK